MMAESFWFNSEAGILSHYQEQRAAEEERHAAAMIRIRQDEESFLSAFRAMKEKESAR